MSLMVYLELLVDSHLPGSLCDQAHVGPHDQGGLGHQAHVGPHLPQLQGDAWECQEDSHHTSSPLVNLIYLKECKELSYIQIPDLLVTNLLVTETEYECYTCEKGFRET